MLVAEFDSVKPIGDEMSETLQYTPARLVVLEHACTKDGYAWLCDVLKRLPNHPVTKLAELLPFNWKRQSITQT